MFPDPGAAKRLVPYEILDRIRRHFVGRVATLAAATTFNAILSVALLPLATQHLGTSGYAIYSLLMSIVLLVSAAADCCAVTLVTSHSGCASPSERARRVASLALCSGSGAPAAASLMS